MRERSISKKFLVSSSTPQTVAPGCLAHPRDPPTQALLCSLITKRQKVSVLKEDVTRLYLCVAVCNIVKLFIFLYNTVQLYYGDA